jgi:hypothetical protein
VKNPKAIDWQRELWELPGFDLPEIGVHASIFLQFEVWDSLESEAVILYFRA